MVLQIKAPILGFESLQSVVMKPIDELFATLHATNADKVSFTVCNPYMLMQEYDFEIPDSVKMLLEIDETTNVAVYNMVITQDPIENSMVNLLAPLVINMDKKLMAQVALNNITYPDFEIQKPLSTFK